MGKYLRTAFFKEVENAFMREEISFNKMLDLIEEEVLKNYNDSGYKNEKLSMSLADSTKKTEEVVKKSMELKEIKDKIEANKFSLNLADSTKIGIELLEKIKEVEAKIENIEKSK